VDSAELRYRRFGKRVMEPGDHDNILLCKMYSVGGTGLLAEQERWGIRSSSENDRGAKVALRAHRTYTHTQRSPPDLSSLI
jgi:hypothetical protein